MVANWIFTPSYRIEYSRQINISYYLKNASEGLFMLSANVDDY